MEKLILTTRAADCRFELKPRKTFAKPKPDEEDEEDDYSTAQQADGAEGLPPETEELPILIGYAIKWGDTSDDRGGYYARFTREGFKAADGGMLALYGHDLNMPLGNTANGTLTYTPDDYGLKVEITPPDTSYARDAVELVGKQYVQGMSFGMFPETYEDVEEDGETIRTYTAYTVDEVTVTAGPAFKTTSIGLQLQKGQNEKPTTPIRDGFSIRLEGMRFDMLNI